MALGCWQAYRSTAIIVAAYLLCKYIWTSVYCTVLSQSIPRAKSHLVIPTSSPLGLLHHPLLRLPKLH